MRVLPVLFSASSDSAARIVAPVRTSANTASNRPFDGESVYDERVAERRGADRRKPAVSQDGTSDFAPLWHEPPLASAFVAQVLGQVLMDRGARPLAEAPAAYRRGAQIGSGLLLSRKV
jgi:hypothetical protein